MQEALPNRSQNFCIHSMRLQILKLGTGQFLFSMGATCVDQETRFATCSHTFIVIQHNTLTINLPNKRTSDSISMCAPLFGINIKLKTASVVFAITDTVFQPPII